MRASAATSWSPTPTAGKSLKGFERLTHAPNNATTVNWRQRPTGCCRAPVTKISATSWSPTPTARKSPKGLKRRRIGPISVTCGKERLPRWTPTIGQTNWSVWRLTWVSRTAPVTRTSPARSSGAIFSRRWTPKATRTNWSVRRLTWVSPTAPVTRTSPARSSGAIFSRRWTPKATRTNWSVRRLTWVSPTAPPRSRWPFARRQCILPNRSVWINRMGQFWRGFSWTVRSE